MTDYRELGASDSMSGSPKAPTPGFFHRGGAPLACLGGTFGNPKERPMPAERVAMRLAREIIRLKFSASVPTREIARRLGLAPSTVRKMLKRFKSGGLGWPLPEGMGDEELEAALYANHRGKRGHRLHSEPDWPPGEIFRAAPAELMHESVSTRKGFRTGNGKPTEISGKMGSRQTQ